MGKTIYANVCFYRVVGMGLNELARSERLEATSQSDLMKQIQAIKKEVASMCKYNLKRDRVYHKISYVDEWGREI